MKVKRLIRSFCVEFHVADSVKLTGCRHMRFGSVVVYQFTIAELVVG